MTWKQILLGRSICQAEPKTVFNLGLSLPPFLRRDPPEYSTWGKLWGVSARLVQTGIRPGPVWAPGAVPAHHLGPSCPWASGSIFTCGAHQFSAEYWRRVLGSSLCSSFLPVTQSCELSSPSWALSSLFLVNRCNRLCLVSFSMPSAGNFQIIS